ncbi:MAG: hypothetical protein HS127_16775 [Planctomycetia bacterium]|nr:hypothetical protein [Planctomycetia bacterium]
MFLVQERRLLPILSMRSLQAVRKDHCLSFSQAYVKDDTETYRSVSSAIGYTTRTQEIDNRMLAWSTV